MRHRKAGLRTLPAETTLTGISAGADKLLRCANNPSKPLTLSTMRPPADRREDNAVIGDCAWEAMAFLQHRLRTEHRDRFAAAEIVEHVGRTRPDAAAHMRAALELLRDQEWLREQDGVWSLTEAGRRRQLSSVARLATFLGLDAAERAARADTDDVQRRWGALTRMFLDLAETLPG